ncbi:hypothetical protein [Thalassotalea sp. PLHSN55]|uniref:hypothetical protein n=1 Tax=Thalassotalea sp. PLHSN55 TaxID=3435888 RepID=UPI003F83B48E
MKKRFLQKVSSVCAKISFATAFVIGILLFTLSADASEVYRSSLGAGTFFFFMVGIVLHAIGSADLPNLTPGKD